MSTPSSVPPLAGLAYRDGRLYGVSNFSSALYVFDAATLAFETSIDTGINDSYLSGIAGDPSRDTLWAVGQVGPGSGRIYQIDPDSGEVKLEFADTNSGLYEQDIAYSNGQLIVSETNGFGAGHNLLAYYDTNTLSYLGSLPYQGSGLASGLGGDGLGGLSQDWFQFNVNAGDNLVITTTTPGGTTASGLQFTNDLDPTINLYDESRQPGRHRHGNAGDGRNDVIDWTALSSGSYRMQIVGADKDNLGEYTISVQGATGGQYAFNVDLDHPAAGPTSTSAGDMTVTFNNSILLTSVSTDDLQIDGNYATA